MALITNIIGFVAAVVGTTLMIPQVLKILRTKKVKDISLGMMVLYFVNCLFWLTYGILILSWPVIVCNGVALIISIIQLTLKLRYESSR